LIVQPFDYITQVRDPVQMALAGYTQGQGLLANRQQMAAQQQQMEMQRTLFDQQQQAMQAQQQRGQEVQGILASMIDDVNTGRMTPERFFEYENLIPEMREDLRKSYEGLESRQRQGMVQDRTRLAMALVNNPDVAKSMIDNMQVAAENSGNEADAAFLKALAQIAETEPAAALVPLVAELGVLMEPKQHQAFMSALFPEPPEPLIINGMIVDPVTMEILGDFSTPAQRGEMTDYQRAQLSMQRDRMGQETSEYGLSPIYGRDAEGNRVLLQTAKAGGVQAADLPEGVTLEDEYSKAFGRGLGAGEAQMVLQRTKRETGLEQARDDINNLVDTIDTALKQITSLNTGAVGQFVEASNLDATLGTIKANAAFRTLQNMRDNSPTGGALGQVSERELDLLMAAAAALNRSQSKQQLERNLRNFQGQVERSLQRIEEAFERDYNSGLFGGATPQQARERAFGRPGGGRAPSNLSDASEDDLFSILKGGE